jgi:serine/threonine protein kinase/formylglycine-generating enzyme required for sulfatase activity
MSPPEILEDFRIVREIGRGGMGVVYLADQKSIQRTVALKVLAPQFSLLPDAIQRFQREAKTAARLRHPGIVQTHAVGEENGVHFIVMEYVEGRPLDRLLFQMRGDTVPADDRAKTLTLAPARTVTIAASGAAPASEPVPGEKPEWSTWSKSYVEYSCALVAQVADALQYAHEAGVIHRDVKPANILVRKDDTAVLTDFGLARQMDLPSITQTGQFAGTPYYVSPEQAMAHRVQVDHRTDVYSLGVTLFELLTLRRPFEGRTSQEILGKIIAKEPPNPKRLNPRLPQDLVTIVLKAIEKDPDRRYGTAADLAGDLRRFLAYEHIRARPASWPVRLRRYVRSHPAVSAATTIALAGLLAIAGLTGVQSARTRLRIQEKFSSAEIAGRSGDFGSAIGAMMSVLDLSPSNEIAGLMLEQYRQRSADAARDRAESDNQKAIDAQIARAEESFTESERLRALAQETAAAAPPLETARFEREIELGRARELDEASRRMLESAARQLVEALTIPTSAGYRREAIEARATDLYARLLVDAEASGESSLALAAAGHASELNRRRRPEIDRLVAGTGTLTVRCSAAGAVAHLFRFLEAPPGSPYAFRRVPVPVPPVAARALGDALEPRWDRLRLGSLDVPTAEEIEAALSGTDGAPCLPASDDSLFDECRLPPLPIENAPITMGSYLLVVRAAGYATLRFPFVVGRSKDVRVLEELLEEHRVPEGFVYVPGGETIVFGGERTTFTLDEQRVTVGHFLISRREVTVHEYREFLDELATEGSDPRGFVPRLNEATLLWPEPEPGSPWGLGQPGERAIGAISLQDAAAYCIWLSEKFGVRYRLPTEIEWERAARGADGRRFPWGDRFLPTFCSMGYSRRDGGAAVEPPGRFLADVSPFGLLDMAGNVSEFCSTLDPEGILGSGTSKILALRSRRELRFDPGLHLLRGDPAGAQCHGLPPRGRLPAREGSLRSERVSGGPAIECAGPAVSNGGPIRRFNRDPSGSRYPRKGAIDDHCAARRHARHCAGAGRVGQVPRRDVRGRALEGGRLEGARLHRLLHGLVRLVQGAGPEGLHGLGGRRDTEHEVRRAEGQRGKGRGPGTAHEVQRRGVPHRGGGRSCDAAGGGPDRRLLAASEVPRGGEGDRRR